MADDFGDPDDGEVFGVDYDVAAGGAHAVSAGAKERDAAGDASAQSFNQLASIHVARSLAGGDENLHAAIVRECVLRAIARYALNSFLTTEVTEGMEKPSSCKSVILIATAVVVVQLPRVCSRCHGLRDWTE